MCCDKGSMSGRAFMGEKGPAAKRLCVCVCVCARVCAFLRAPTMMLPADAPPAPPSSPASALLDHLKITLPCIWMMLDQSAGTKHSSMLTRRSARGCQRGAFSLSLSLSIFPRPVSVSFSVSVSDNVPVSVSVSVSISVSLCLHCQRGASACPAIHAGKQSLMHDKARSTGREPLGGALRL